MRRRHRVITRVSTEVARNRINIPELVARAGVSVLVEDDAVIGARTGNFQGQLTVLIDDDVSAADDRLHIRAPSDIYHLLCIAVSDRLVAGTARSRHGIITPRAVAVVEHIPVLREKAVGGRQRHSFRLTDECLHRPVGPAIDGGRRPFGQIIGITQPLPLAGLHKITTRQFGRSPPDAALQPVFHTHDRFHDIVQLRVVRHIITRHDCLEKIDIGAGAARQAMRRPYRRT